MPWYYIKEQKRYGPVTEAELLALIKDGRLGPADYVWRPGLDSWPRAGELVELFPPPPIPDNSEAASLSVAPPEAKRIVEETPLPGDGGPQEPSPNPIPSPVRGASTTPNSAFLFAAASSLLVILPMMLALFVIVRLVPVGHQRVPILAVSVGFLVCFPIIGWFFGRKFPTTGWRLWAVLITGPWGGYAAYLAAVSPQDRSVTDKLVGVFGVMIVWYLIAFLPTGLSARAATRKTRRRAEDACQGDTAPVSLHQHFANYTNDEIEKWLFLRAVEWTAWPTFVSQPLIPVLIAVFSILPVLAGLLAADLLWRFVRYSFISPTLAKIGALFTVFLKWPSAIGSAIYLLAHQNYVLAVVAALWPLLAGLVNAPVSLVAGLLGFPNEVGRVELSLAEAIGYVPRE